MTVHKTIRLPAKMDFLHAFMAFTIDCANAEGFSAERTYDLELAVEEILVNIIHYAYPEKKGEIEITCRPVQHDRLAFKIMDGGVPFNMLAYKDPDTNAAIEERRIGGLGIYFVKRLMDEVTYSRENDRNCLTIVLSKNRREDQDEPV
jgi:anti-sigma regulatory factor (Ser/Thr protein kinase)